MDLGSTFLKRHHLRDDPLSAQTIVQRTTMRREDWSVRIRSRVRLSATRDAFQFGAVRGRSRTTGRSAAHLQLAISRQLV